MHSMDKESTRLINEFIHIGDIVDSQTVKRKKKKKNSYIRTLQAPDNLKSKTQKGKQIQDIKQTFLVQHQIMSSMCLPTQKNEQEKNTVTDLYF